MADLLLLAVVRFQQLLEVLEVPRRAAAAARGGRLIGIAQPRNADQHQGQQRRQRCPAPGGHCFHLPTKQRQRIRQRLPAPHAVVTRVIEQRQRIRHARQQRAQVAVGHGDNHAVSVRRKHEAVDVPRRHRYQRTAAQRLAALFEQGFPATRMDVQNLQESLMPVGLDLPSVQAAARGDGLEMQLV
ncbi:hypothetical protein D3C72_1354570 [compost metagenome]